MNYLAGALRENSENGAAYVYELDGTNWIAAPSGGIGSLYVDSMHNFLDIGETNEDIHIASGETEIDWMNPTAIFSSGT